MAGLAATATMAGKFDADQPLSPKVIAAAPETYYGKEVLLEGMRCVAVNKAFSCVNDAGGRMLRIDGDGLIYYSAPAAAKFMENECTGTANLMRDQCLMNVSFTPRIHSQSIYDTGNGTMPLVVIKTDLLAAFAPEKRRRH
jgi:hypothetical protein